MFREAICYEIELIGLVASFVVNIITEHILLSYLVNDPVKTVVCKCHLLMGVWVFYRVKTNIF